MIDIHKLENKFLDEHLNTIINCSDKYFKTLKIFRA